jgi:hypothetical protein
LQETLDEKGAVIMDEEKRREERIRLEVPVMLANGTGMSRDISGSAIYFVINQFIPPGSPINFFVRLEHECLDRPLHLQCHGFVLRVEAAGEKFGIAASGIHLGGLSPSL